MLMQRDKTLRRGDNLVQVKSVLSNKKHLQERDVVSTWMQTRVPPVYRVVARVVRNSRSPSAKKRLCAHAVNFSCFKTTFPLKQFDARWPLTEADIFYQFPS